MSQRSCITCLGMKLPGPIVLAAGPLSDSFNQIENAFQAGACSVVTKTIYVGEAPARNEHIACFKNYAFNSTAYSHKPLKKWLHDLKSLSARNYSIIANIHAANHEMLGPLARNVADCGVQAIELGISCPVERPTNGKAIEDMVSRSVASVRSFTDIGLSVKLTAGDLIARQAQAAIDAGADAITVSDTLPAVVIDVKRRQLKYGGPVGYSGAAIRPLVLHSIYQIKKAGIECPIIGVGGIECLSDVLEYLFAGCIAVQVMTAAMNCGVDILAKLQSDLSSWCDENQVNVDEMVGIAIAQGRSND